MSDMSRVEEARERLQALAAQLRQAGLVVSKPKRSSKRKINPEAASTEGGALGQPIEASVPPLSSEQMEREINEIHESGLEEVLIDQLDSTVPPGLAIPILKRLTRTRAARANPTVCRLVMHHENEGVRKQAVQYIAALNSDDGERFLQQLALTADEALIALGKWGCEQFTLLSPERSFLDAMIKQRPSDVLHLQDTVRVERLAQLIPKLPPYERERALQGMHSHAPVIAGRLAQFSKGGGVTAQPPGGQLLGATGDLSRVPVPSGTTVLPPRLDLLIASAEQAPPEVIDQIVAAGFGDVARALRTIRRADLGGFFRRLLRHPSHRGFAFGLLEQSTEWLLAAMPELRILLLQEAMPVQIPALVLLARVADVAIPDVHLDYLSEGGVAVRWPQWVKLLAERRPIDLMDRWERLPGPVADLVLQAWIDTSPRNAVRLVWLRIGDWTREGYPVSQALPLAQLGTRVAVATGQVQAFQPMLRLAVDVIAVTEGHIMEALTIARSLEAEAWLTQPRLFNRLPQQDARALLQALLERQNPEGRIRLVAGMVREAYEQGLTAAYSLLIAILTEEVLKHPDTLPLTMQTVSGLPIAQGLLQETSRRLAQLQEAERFMRAEVDGVRLHAHRTLGKAIGHPLGNLEYFLSESCAEDEQGYRRKVSRLVKELRIALERAGLAPAEPDFTEVPFDPHKHQLVPPGAAPIGPVLVMSLGIQVPGEKEPMVPAIVVIPREGRK